MEQELVNDIIKDVLAGKVNAFETLLDEYKQLVFHIVAKRIPEQDVDAVSHDAFIRVFKSLANYKQKSPFKNWLAKITVYCCYDYWKQKEREGRLVTAPLDDEHVNWLEAMGSEIATERFEQDFSRKEAVELLNIALNQLKADDRTVLELYYIEGWSMRDISSSLNWSIAKVKIKAMRARMKMKKILKKIFFQG